MPILLCREARGEAEVVNKDIISSTVIFLFAAAAWWIAGSYGGGAGLFPRGLAVIMMVVSALMLIRAFFWPTAVPKGTPPMSRGELRVTAICVVSTMIYIALTYLVGFGTSSVFFIIALAYLLGYRHHLAIWGTAIVFVNLLYLVFVRIFHTPLPNDVLFDRFW